MLRSDEEIIRQGLLTAKATLGELKRGRVTFDSADVASKADGVLLGTVLGLPVYRDAALGAGKYVYTSEAGVVLASN